MAVKFIVEFGVGSEISCVILDLTFKASNLASKSESKPVSVCAPALLGGAAGVGGSVGGVNGGGTSVAMSVTYLLGSN